MDVVYSEKYSFLGEWYDNQANLIRRFHIFFYPYDDSLEMYDIRSRKPFVRRIKVDGITLDSFYVGCTLYILGRLVKIVDFGCENTRAKLQHQMEVTFAVIKPIPTNIAGKIITYFHEHGLRVSRMKKARLAVDDVHILFKDMVSDPTFPFLLEYLSNQLVYGIELVGKDAVALCTKIIGHQDPLKAEPDTIRALYGSDPVRNCVYSVCTNEDAVANLEYFFPPPLMSSARLRLTATLSNCTLCIVKPHAIREGKLGLALELIDEGGFNITALTMFIVENIYAAEFYEVYKGIVPEFKGMVEELASGPCVAMEVVAKDKNVDSAVEFRKLVGPSDPEIARLLRPNTLRAKLGITKVKNAIHCSDLAEDGLLEVEYFFKILSI